jgi:hypothetical protein
MVVVGEWVGTGKLDAGNPLPSPRRFRRLTTFCLVVRIVSVLDSHTTTNARYHASSSSTRARQQHRSKG